MARTYPLTPWVIGGDEDYTPHVWSKGHHDPCRFLRHAALAVRSEVDEYEARVVLRRGHGAVRHEWWRTDVYQTRLTGNVVYESVRGPGPGVFPATIIWLDT